MDEYLNTLVKKEDEVKEVVEEKVAAVEEPVVAEPIKEEVKEVVEEQKKEQSKKEVKIQKEEPKAEEKKSVEKKPEEKKVEKKESKKSGLVAGQEYDVDTIRVYAVPDEQQVSKTVTGKVVYVGTVEPFDIIKYMKHGFGLVQGYVKDLKSAIK